MPRVSSPDDRGQPTAHRWYLMQTFLTNPNFRVSAMILDRQRLGKQRVEVLQLALGLSDPTRGWQNHPAMSMWRGYGLTLVEYGQTVCDVWTERGYADTCHGKLEVLRPKLAMQGETDNSPWWLGNMEFHFRHASNLVYKDPDHYSRFWPGMDPDYAYWWPCNICRSFSKETGCQAAHQAA